MRKRYSAVVIGQGVPDGGFAELELTALNAHNAQVLLLYRERVEDIDSKYLAMLEGVVDRVGSEMHEIQANAAAELEQAEQRREMWHRVGAGMSAAGRALAESSPRSYVAEQRAATVHESSCTSDYACHYGQVCGKRYGAANGYCVQAVNEYGSPIPQAPSPDSYQVGDGQCLWTGCPIGFTCRDGNCVR